MTGCNKSVILGLNNVELILGTMVGFIIPDHKTGELFLGGRGISMMRYWDWDTFILDLRLEPMRMEKVPAKYSPQMLVKNGILNPPSTKISYKNNSKLVVCFKVVLISESIL